MPYCPKHKISFIHTPKTGGTSVSLYLKLKTLGHYRWAREKELNPSYTSFCIKRHPIDRALSSYYYAQHKKNYWHNENNLHPDYNLLKSASFDECVQLLRDKKLHHYGWSHQHSWSCENNSIKVDHVLRFEYLNEDFNKLMRVLDVPSVGPLPVINSAQRPPNTQVSQFSRDTLKEIYSKDFELFEYE